MSHITSLTSAFIISSFFLAHAEDHTSQTFMFTHPVAKNILLEQLVWQATHAENHGDSITLIGISQRSIADKAPASYFSLPGKYLMTVAGDNTSALCTRDIRAEWLGISDSTFSGSFSLNPKQYQYSMLCAYYHTFSLGSYGPHWWFCCLIPFLTIQNTLGITELSSSIPNAIIAAFNQSTWPYAKMAPETRKKNGIGEIDLRMGKTFYEPYYTLDYYAGISIPTACKQNASYLFNPFLANNGHIGALMGITSDITLQPTCYSLFIDFETVFLLPNSQYRTFDLQQKKDGESVFIKKPFSRYLLLNRQDGPPNQNIPGVSILTQKVHVHPYAFFNTAGGLRITSEHGQLELGYALWGRADEKISLSEPFPEIYGIAGTGSMISPLTGCTVATSASKSTIAFQAPNDATFVAIRAIDLDLESAASKGTFTNQVSARLSYAWHCTHSDGQLHVGSWYEIPSSNSALPAWVLWAGLNLSF